MSELRSAIEALRGEVLSELPDAVVEEDFAEVHRACEQLQVERLRRLVEIERRRLFERDGHVSAAAWLRTRFKVTHGAARADLRLGRALEEMPATRRALADGEISASVAGILVSVREANPQEFAADEGFLVESARLHSTNDLKKVAAYWRDAVERERGADGEDKLRERRRLHVSTTFLGMVRVDGDLDPETGECLLTALRAVMDAEARSRPKDDPDPRSPAQRRADAVEEVCRQWLDLADRPTVAGERPHVTLVVDASGLGEGGKGREQAPGERDLGPMAELEHTGPVGPEVLSRLLCDASVARVVLAGGSEPLDVGRKCAVVPAPMRRAVVARDRRCRFPGCGRPPAWCEAHHVVPWEDGGPTAVANLVLLCRSHHRLVHRRRRPFGLKMVEGRPVFCRPDGTVLEERAPP
ncbi:MAG: HNH endonuclease [Actinomycetota bacterium]|nr:HNH endonuclease [Actinomycetota bacterium]